ncbi:MAG: GNAT family N-acetyltransferase [Acidimicrobiales bacterium]|nr:GNAT family N-acetyltransferase [Acidimicrobiales bacterium]
MENHALELVDFDFDRDMDDVLAMWKEVGWCDEERTEPFVREFFQANDGRSVVARLNGRAESVAHRSLGSIKYGADRELSAGAITAVTTSRIGRRLRGASRLTARSVATLGGEGCAIALLGMFEQGFYDRFGFGVGPYEHVVRVSPGSLRVPCEYRTPERFDFENHSEELYEAVVRRHRGHGGLLIGGERAARTIVMLDQQSSVYGYRTDGVLSHWIAVEHQGEHGPDNVIAWAYETPAQCLELLRLCQEWSDQTDVIRFTEPVWLQAQDFIDAPGTNRRRTHGSKASVSTEAFAWWQIRILDLAACVRPMVAVEDPFDVVVDLSDPIGSHLVDSGYDGSWEPLTGLWRLSFSESHSAERLPDGSEAADLTTSVNALSRWWLGVLPASALAAVGQMDGDPAIFERLDLLTAHLPRPQPGWDF